jgi:hypothetical protein
MKQVRSIVASIVCVALAFPVPAQVPPPGSAPSAAAAPAASPGAKSFSQQELEQLLAPIALYPDALMAQVLMASTYPLEVVQAERWRKANPSLKDKALEDALQQQPWDASVKSLAVFPQVLTMMSDKIDWTQKLGDAFLAQQQDVMATAQALRQGAEGGTLKDTKEQKVTTQTENNTTYIVIEPTNPEVVYVPTYNPTVVYGAWPYPAYPPYAYYPPGYVAGGALLGFAAGVIVGGALWGGCNWGRGDVNVNVNRYNNFNRTNISNGNWNHAAQHRGAVPYRDQGFRRSTAAVSRRMRHPATSSADAPKRGSRRSSAVTWAAEVAIRRPIARWLRPRRRGAGRDSAANRSMSGGRGDMGGAGNSAFNAGGGGAQARQSSSRGASSMNSARSSGNMSGGGARGGGGGGRGGGGGGGRGGGGRR